MDLHGRVREFLERTLGAMGVPLEIAIEERAVLAILGAQKNDE